MKAYFTLIIALYLCLISCRSNNDEQNQSVEYSLAKNNSKTVKTEIIEMSTFSDIIISNGNISSYELANIPYLQNQPLIEISVNNGSKVVKGEIIASSDKTLLNLEREKVNLEIEKAEIIVKTKLIELGYSDENMHEVSNELLTIIKANADIPLLKNQLKTIDYKIEKTNVRVPFNGIVANLCPYLLSTAKECPFLCTIINQNKLTVDFKILDSELELIKIGTQVEIKPLAYYSEPVLCKIVEINPVIDEGGSVKISAKILSKKRWLIVGTDVHVAIKTSQLNQLVVPKNAIVQRQGKDVVFVSENNIAKWKYVEIGSQNEDLVTIRSGLKAGDKIVIEGNIDLVQDDSLTEN